MSGLKLVLVASALATPVAAIADQNMSSNQTAAAARFSLDTPIEALVAEPQTRAVLEANLPGLTGHPMYESFKGMSLRQLQPMSQGRLTDEVLARVGAALAAIR